MDLHHNGNASLRYSAHHGHLPIVKDLLQQGADIHDPHDESLRMIAQQEPLPVVQHLTRHSALLSAGLEYAQDNPKVLEWLQPYQFSQQKKKSFSTTSRFCLNIILGYVTVSC